MKEIKVIRVKAKMHFASNTFDDNEQLVKDMAYLGYSYKGFIPAKIVGYGSLSEIDLIFEKEE